MAGEDDIGGRPEFAFLGAALTIGVAIGAVVAAWWPWKIVVGSLVTLVSIDLLSILSHKFGRLLRFLVMPRWAKQISYVQRLQAVWRGWEQ